MKPGDSLFSIAQTYGTTAQEIATVNQLPNPNRLVVGQALVIPVWGSFYVGKVAERYKGDFMVAGHSKGGNMAAFSAMNSPKEVRERITDIYSFDGPGFRPEILEEYNYRAIASRVHKFLPKSSLVGIVLEWLADSIII